MRKISSFVFFVVLFSSSQVALAQDAEPESSASLADFVGGLFILVMFTNAVICGHWALNTGRNFWCWYLFGLFTGPLAGGFMLHKSAQEKSGEKNPGGTQGAIAGIAIPIIGFLIWAWLLSENELF